MKVKSTIIPILVWFYFTACNSGPLNPNTIKYVNARFDSINVLLKNETEQVTVLAKLHSNDTLINLRLSQPGSPYDIDTIYSFLKGSDGRLIIFGETPVLKNENWKAVSTHYFDHDGKTLVFTNQNTFLNNICSEKIVSEFIVEYYDKSFSLISKEHSLKDEKGNMLKEKKCRTPFEISYQIYPYSDSLLKKISRPVKL